MKIKKPNNTRAFLQPGIVSLLGVALSCLSGCAVEGPLGEGSGESSELEAAGLDQIRPASQASRTAALGLRQTPDKSQLATALPADLSNASIIIKFQEGTGVQLRGSALSVDPARSHANVGKRLDSKLVDSELRGLAARLKAEQLPVSALFRTPVDRLDRLRANGEKRLGKNLAELALYFEVPWKGTSRNQLSRLIEELNALDIVELAYVQPLPEDATIQPVESLDPLSSTPDFTHLQGYVGTGVTGIGVSAARAYAGGEGENVRVIDIETRWTPDHEDLSAPFFYIPNPVPGDTNHGTAVAGVIVGQDNGFGVTGISPAAGIGYASHAVGVATAMSDAIDALDPGDMLLLEMHFSGGPTTVTCTCNHGQCNFVPTEYYQAYYDIIETASANGIVVVEAGGNGSVNLDHPSYLGIFDRNVRDSGAIMVGATSSSSRTPTCWSNHGSRIDLHGWGENVATTGYGDLYDGPLGPLDDYTAYFSGTSSASPIVTGAAVLVQSIAIEENGVPLDPFALRALLVSTGKAQTGNLTRPIGVLPDLTVAAPLAGSSAVCGDAVCDVTETCSSCAADCGPCASSCVPVGCESAPTVTIPYVVDGPVNTCVFFTSSSFVTSWNMANVEVNGADVTNQWVASSAFPATCDGGYYLQSVGNFAWSHVEVR